MAPVLKADAEQLWRRVPRPGDVLELGVSLRQALGLQRQIPATRPVIGRREAWLLGAFALSLHLGVLAWLAQREPAPLPEVPVVIPPMTIEFAPPPPPPAPVEPEPVVDELATKPPPPPKPKAAPKPKPVEPPPEPPKAETPPPAPVAAPPAPPVETAPSANADYLQNPAPEYPALALRRGWQGTVLLRVQVLPSGRPGEIQIQSSSGRDLLDQAALRAVKRWRFVPAKRGDQAVAGWVSVPLDFRLN